MGIEIEQYVVRENKVWIYLGKDQHLRNWDKLLVVNRKTKDVLAVFHADISVESRIIIDFENAAFKNLIEGMIFDFYLNEIKENKRIQIYPYKTVKEEYRFYNDWIKDANRNYFLPYIAKNGFLSILYSNRLQLAQESKEKIKNVVDIKIEKYLGTYVEIVLDRKYILQDSMFMAKENGKYIKLRFWELLGEGNSQYVKYRVELDPHRVVDRYVLKFLTFGESFYIESDLRINNETSTEYISENTIDVDFGGHLLITESNCRVYFDAITFFAEKAHIQELNNNNTRANIITCEARAAELVMSFREPITEKVTIGLTAQNKVHMLEYQQIENDLVISFDNRVEEFLTTYEKAKLIIFFGNKKVAFTLSEEETYLNREIGKIAGDFSIIFNYKLNSISIMSQKKKELLNIGAIAGNLPVFNRAIGIKINQVNDKELLFQLTDKQSYKKIDFYLIERTEKTEVKLQYIETENGFLISMDNLIDDLVFQKSRYDFYCEITYDFMIYRGKLFIPNHKIEEKAKRYLNTMKPPANMLTLKNKNQLFMLFLSKYNELSAVIRDKKFIFEEKYEFKTNLKKCQVMKGKLDLELEFTIPGNVKNITPESVILTLRSKVKEQIIKADLVDYTYTGHSILIRATLNLMEHQYEQFYYDVFLVAQIEEERVYSRVESHEKEFNNALNHNISGNYLFLNENMLYPYITERGVLFIAYRNMDESVYNMALKNETKAIKLYERFKYQLDAEKVWLVYEKESETAQDNSYYFFKYCYEHHKNKKIYYIIKENSPDIANLKGMEDRVLTFMSVKHLVYLQAAELLVASETRGHAYLWRYQKGKIKDILNKKTFVFLQHGVTAFKLNDSILRKESPSGASMYVTTSEFEKNIIKNGLGYDSKDIIVSGFPRWDVLEDVASQNKVKEILIMPTWRSWLDEVSEEEFLESDYYIGYMKLLNSKELAAHIEKHNVIINFLLHPKFKQYIGTFDVTSDNFNLVPFGEVKINELLMRSALLITDYSSVAWEMYYMAKPVIFYQFDYDTYMELTGSYIEMKDVLFGDRAIDIDTLVEAAKTYIDNDFSEKAEYQAIRPNYFAYIDDKNSQRVYNGILNSSMYEQIAKKKYNNRPLLNRVKLGILKFMKLI